MPSTLVGLGESVVCPSGQDVAKAALAFGASPWASLAEESGLPRLYITPGALVLTRKSARQLVREAELAQIRRIAAVNAAAGWGAADAVYSVATRAIVRWGERSPDPVPTREVTEWSAKSRVNMTKTLASLDWSPLHRLGQLGRVPAMVTLTYPGEWEAVAPDGHVVKRHVRALLWRYGRAWGEQLLGAWKLEFQRRGAPHVHIFMAPPHGRAAGRGAGAGLSFHRWLSVVWADIVKHPDPVQYQAHLAAGTGVDFREGIRYADPRRLAVYFGKHSLYRDKEYQHIVPAQWRNPGAGPGRFWGYWGLKVLAIPVEMTMQDYLLAARIARRWSEHIKVWDKEAGRWRYVRAMAPGKTSYPDVDPATGERIWRKHRRRRRVRRFANMGSGFVILNDAPAFAHQLARAVRVCGDGP